MYNNRKFALIIALLIIVIGIFIAFIVQTMQFNRNRLIYGDSLIVSHSAYVMGNSTAGTLFYSDGTMVHLDKIELKKAYTNLAQVNGIGKIPNRSEDYRIKVVNDEIKVYMLSQDEAIVDAHVIGRHFVFKIKKSSLQFYFNELKKDALQAPKK